MIAPTRPTPLTITELRSRPTVTVEEAASALGIGRNAAYEAVRRGDLPALRIGRRIVIPTLALLKLLEEAGRA